MQSDDSTVEKHSHAGPITESFKDPITMFIEARQKQSTKQEVQDEDESEPNSHE